MLSNWSFTLRVAILKLFHSAPLVPYWGRAFLLWTHKEYFRGVRSIRVLQDEIEVARQSTGHLITGLEPQMREKLLDQSNLLLLSGLRWAAICTLLVCVIMGGFFRA